MSSLKARFAQFEEVPVEKVVTPNLLAKMVPILVFAAGSFDSAKFARKASKSKRTCAASMG